MNTILSPNIAYAQNLQLLAAVVECGTAAIEGIIGTDSVADEMNGNELTTQDLQEALASRLSAKLRA